MEYEEDQKHQLLAKMIAYVVLPILGFLFAIIGAIIFCFFY